MNIKNLTFALCLSLGMSASAANTIKNVTQVTEATTVSEDIDFVITGSTPFTAMGSVNITNTDHAVVIIKKYKPSAVLKNYMQNIYINGEKAVDGENCQVKMYDRGAIIFPYGKNYKPLTCFTEKGFGGESCNEYTEGHSGGFMKNLAKSTLDNNFKSFKLKRGYMVTFALGKAGWGYSRVFIADKEDLEMDLPSNMSGHVSSYRIFKWHNAHKAGLASDGRPEANAAVNSCWCYDWAQGNASNLPDVEWVPNHIYEDWPSPAACGSVTGSCHMKTNNEPGNSADDHPQSVETIIDNWQNLMRTGMRLCSESSHDGSWQHLRDFIREIDSRGWRCDLLDLHCYWGAGSFGDFSNYYNEYGGRPIWISEWVWGASWNAGNWNNGGIFAQAPDGAGSFSTANQQKCKDGTVPILEKLNASKYVERYAYWNSENVASKIYHNGQLSLLGKYYAAMDEGMGYNASIQKVPNIVYLNPNSLTATTVKTNDKITLAWNDPNGDMLDSVVVEVKIPGANRYEYVERVELKDMNAKVGAKYTYDYIPTTSGAFYFRIASYPINQKTPKYSEEANASISSSAGIEGFQYGNLAITNTSAMTTDFKPSFSEAPAVFMGAITNSNTTLYPGTLLQSITKDKFNYTLMPWQKQTNSVMVLSNKEDIPFMALTLGAKKIGSLDAVIGKERVGNKETEITFTKPFPEGVTPVILTELFNPNLNKSPIAINVHDVTNTGFKCNIQYEEGITDKAITIDLNLCYLAIEPGFTYVDEGNKIMINAGFGENDVYGTSTKICTFKDGEQTLYFKNPLIFGRSQTFNYPTGTIIRKATDVTDITSGSPTNGLVYGWRVRRMVDTSAKVSITNTAASADKIGYVVIAESNENGSAPTAISNVTSDNDVKAYVHNGKIVVSGISNYDIYSISGTKVDANAVQAPGVYMVQYGNSAIKVLVK